MLAMALAGCASAPPRTGQNLPDARVNPKPVDATRQMVSIRLVSTDGPVVNARCILKNDKGTWEAFTTAPVEIMRSSKPLEITCLGSGLQVALQKSESVGDVIESAAQGAVVGGAVSAVAAMPLLAIPVFGLAIYAGTVGGSALLAGSLNAAVDHSQGTVYVYPSTITIRLTRETSAAAQSSDGTSRAALPIGGGSVIVAK